MSVARTHHTKDYTCMSNHHFKNKNLSLKSKGLLSLMLSLPDEWDYNIKGLAALSSDGETSVRSAIKELEEEGYVKRTPIREYGKIIDWEYDIYEIPLVENQQLENQQLENQQLENLALENNDNKILNKSNTNKSNTNKYIDTKSETLSVIDKVKPKKLSLYDKCVNMINEFTDDTILQELLVASLKLFLENSRESSTPFYSNTFKGKLNNLRKLSDDDYDLRSIVQQTLDNGWNNFYEIKRNNNSKNKTGNFARDVEHLTGGLNRKADKRGDSNEAEKF